MNASESTASARRPWYARIGPGLITACVVIGPGSILTSSTVGANNKYSMLWVVWVSVLFMLVYMTLGAKLGVVAAQAPADLIREKAGKWLAVLVGICVFFISAAFQSGNNLGVAAAFEAFVESKLLVAGLVILFNAVAMLISFAVNLMRLSPDVGGMLKGLVPTVGDIDLAVLGLFGTTFVITAAFYQAYLVRQKGWTKSELSNGLIDARVGSLIMALITVMLMSTAAAGLFTGSTVTLSDPVAVAEALEPTFGTSGKIIFCMGLFSAAYSSFLVNSMIGGFILADGLGLGSKPADLWPRLFTTLALLTGMVIGLAALVFDFDRTPTIIAAQAVTVVGAPLVAGVLFWLTSRRDVMGEHVSGPVTKVLAGIGLAILLVMALNTAVVKLPASFQNYLQKLRAAEVSELPPATLTPTPHRTQ
jgi:manganese transport protein